MTIMHFASVTSALFYVTNVMVAGAGASANPAAKHTANVRTPQIQSVV